LAEPEEAYIAKGGDPSQTAGRVCLRNSLAASAGIPQIRHGNLEPQLITIGADLDALRESLLAGRDRAKPLRMWSSGSWREGRGHSCP
jgi:hypothetical protein